MKGTEHMATNNGHEPAFSMAEVVGISAAAAAALGGIIIALGRTQANSSKTQLPAMQALPGRKELEKQARRGKVFAHDAAETAQDRYPDARDFASQKFEATAEAARVYGSDFAHKAEIGLDKARHQSKAFSEILQESIIPAVIEGAARVRTTVAEQAKNTDKDEIVERSRQYADEAAEHLRHAGENVSRTFQKDVMPVVAPVIKDASEMAGELFENVRDRADDIKHRNDRFPGAKAVSSGKESAHSALQSSSKAATDTLAALMWLLLSSVVVYLVLLSPERRERVKSATFDVIEQVRLLIGDFKGYETEF
jgi:hypothetical protein